MASKQTSGVRLHSVMILNINLPQLTFTPHLRNCLDVLIDAEIHTPNVVTSSGKSPCKKNREKGKLSTFFFSCLSFIVVPIMYLDTAIVGSFAYYRTSISRLLRTCVSPGVL